MKNINIHFASVHRGPGKVVENLVLGLDKLGRKISANAMPDSDTHQICLQPVQHLGLLPRQTIMGPNLFVLPSEWGDFCLRFDHYVVPSNWVKLKYSEFNNLNHATIDTWPVGIDTDSWKKETIRKNKILVYLKHRPEEDLKSVTSILDKMNLDFSVLQYGSYNESELYSACLECDSCILITGTESQGIAYMQILSMGLPCYVLNTDMWDFDKTYKKVPATSVPYFSEECGRIVSTVDENSLSRFLNDYNSFNPRKFIVENHSLVKSADDLIKIFEKYDNEK